MPKVRNVNLAEYAIHSCPGKVLEKSLNSKVTEDGILWFSS